jgi:hypothetical protein
VGSLKHSDPYRLWDFTAQVEVNDLDSGSVLSQLPKVALNNASRLSLEFRKYECSLGAAVVCWCFLL